MLCQVEMIILLFDNLSLQKDGKLEIYDEKFYESFESKFIGGDFFQLISDNFKIVYNKGVAELKTKENKYIYEEKHNSYDFTVVYSKVDKFFYIITYQSWDYTNDGFYCREKFKTKRKFR